MSEPLHRSLGAQTSPSRPQQIGLVVPIDSSYESGKAPSAWAPSAKRCPSFGDEAYAATQLSHPERATFGVAVKERKLTSSGYVPSNRVSELCGNLVKVLYSNSVIGRDIRGGLRHVYFGQGLRLVASCEQPFY